MPILTIPQAENLCMQILTKAGISQKDAVLLFDSMLIPSLRGHDSHGIRRVPVVADQTMKGADTAEGEPVILKEGPATAAIDGRWNPGPIAGAMSTKIAIRKGQKDRHRRGHSHAGDVDGGDRILCRADREGGHDRHNVVPGEHT